MSQEGYGPSWIKAVLMVNPKTKEIHAIGGDREKTEWGDGKYIGFELIREWVHGKQEDKPTGKEIPMKNPNRSEELETTEPDTEDDIIPE